MPKLDALVFLSVIEKSGSLSRTMARNPVLHKPKCVFQFK